MRSQASLISRGRLDDRSQTPTHVDEPPELRISSSSSAHGLPGRFASCVLDLLGPAVPHVRADSESIIYDPEDLGGRLLHDALPIHRAEPRSARREPAERPDRRDQVGLGAVLLPGVADPAGSTRRRPSPPGARRATSAASCRAPLAIARLAAARSRRRRSASRTSSASNGIGSIRQIGSSVDLAAAAPAAAPAAAGTSASIARERSRLSGWRRSTESSARPATAVTMPGSSRAARSCRRRRARGRSARSRAPPRRRRGRRRAWRPSASSRRARPARGSSSRSRSTPGAAGDRRAAQALRLEHRALLDVELEVGAEARRAARGPRARVELDAVLGQHVARSRRRRRRVERPRAPPGRASRRAPSCRTGCARTAAPPRRPSRPARGRGAAARSDPAQARSTPSAAITPSAPSSQPAVRHRVEVGAERERRGAAVGARQPRPEVARLVDLGARCRSRRAARGGSRAPPPIPASSRRGGRPPAPPVSAASSRRSAITRAASIAGAGASPSAQPTRSRRSAWARQWAPPPPSVNIVRSGSKTSRPRARSCSLRLFEYSLSRAPARRRARSR